MSFLGLFSFIVFAAETVVSPIPDNTPVVVPPPPRPMVSFGQINTTLPAVLGAATDATPTPTPTPIIQTRKKSYTIALLGDSMIDTLGPGVPALAGDLKHYYTATNFTILNYGVGSTNIDYGITRITNDYDYLGKHFPSLASEHPDVVVLESFAYNPYPIPNGVDEHWLALSKAVDTLRATIPGVQIIIAATIAPNNTVFGDGAAGLSFSPADKVARTDTIKAYLGSTVKFAQGQHLPLADAYHASLDSAGNGFLRYINPGDHIHYSEAGRQFFAQKVMDTIRTTHLLE